MFVFLLLLVAVICFVLAALKVDAKINWIAVGLAFFVAAFIPGNWPG